MEDQNNTAWICGGKQPLEQACRAKNLTPEPIMREIEDARVASAAGRDWRTASLEELVRCP